MKLFKTLLAAPAVLGLLVPLSTSASDINIVEMNSYARKKSSSKKQFNSNTFSQEVSKNIENVEIIDPTFKHIEAGSFSETTTMSGAVSFQVGAVDESDITQALTSTYSYDIDLNTSFTGDDNLYIGIETGNSGSVAFNLDSSGGGADQLSVTSMYYQMPLGKYDIAFGPLLDVDDFMPTTTSKYSDSFYFGGNLLLAKNFFVSQGTGAGVALARNFDNGLNASASLVATGADTQAGILTAEGTDVLTLSFGYDADNYGGGFIYTSSDSSCTISGQFVTDACNTYGVSAAIDEGYSAYALGGYWDVSEKTTISATISHFDADAKGLSIDALKDFQIGVDRQTGPGILSASWKTVPFFIVHDVNEDRIDEDYLGSYLEVYYTYAVNDAFEIKPGVAYALPATDAGSFPNDDIGFFLLDQNIYGIEATFKF